ncbi:putative intracellular protease/amidase [Roseimicrobium gellanilyticum]|uniref:Putative intracellular protease/amidase n=1 Tax=Roseimicrobium gellanilyticum TaxID=748857 RepID=A0A366H9N1_9BACT|nr:DJ-1/PfpI family protein [Roseimicrobium gellanilyticum]RBP38133.1 putative intracellular protease/amidase [Roseimicrobium gellanilyticum]
MKASTEKNSSTLTAGPRRWTVSTLAILLVMTNFASTQAQPSEQQKGKVLFAVTSHDKKGDTGEPTGFYLSEVAHPWDVLVNAGYEIDFVSPKGGKAPVDGFDLADPINKKFWEDKVYREKIEHTKKPSEVAPTEYVAIHFAGGHGTMWDFPDNVALAKIAATIYENNGIVSAVCHGPAGLVNIKLSNGKYLVHGKRINAFTNEEEVAVKLDKVVPFLLESKLIERGATFEKSAPFHPHVVADQRVVTGQNPQSATAVGNAVLEELKHITAVGKLTRYSVKPESRETFRKAMTDYVTQARDEKGNIQAEAFSEQDKDSVFWLIERWKDRSELQRFGDSVPAKAVDALKPDALDAKEETYIVKDWSRSRRSSGAGHHEQKTNRSP